MKKNNMASAPVCKSDACMSDMFSSAAFEKKYTYKGSDLGAAWSVEKTSFRIWAPTASAVKVRLYESGCISACDEIKTVNAAPSENGTWTAVIDGNLDGTYYTYLVTVGGYENEACDPYAKAVGVNGDRAMIIDMSSVNPEGWENDKNPNAGKSITDAIIYELHVRDFSADESSGIMNKGKYLGITESGTKNAHGEMTGLDYIKDLGITHLQLNPVFDFATVDETKLGITHYNQYNWGYDPKNYNAPEGSYSTDPYDGKVRVKELKEMIKRLHDNNISVVVDVVYNHTYDTDYCFNKTVPGYFYRRNSDGTLSNGSGCGNDTASERSMVRKFIVDSVIYWASEYHINGFRFDLMGLLDVKTMNLIRIELDKIDPSIIIYGEGWHLPSAISKPVATANQSNSQKMPRIAMFNDSIRDAIKGSVFNASEKGYVNGEFGRIGDLKEGVVGRPYWAGTPKSVITYASCHDNNTLWDTINISNACDSFKTRIKQNMLAGAIIFTSQGTPFMLAGEEMLRTKRRDDGSYEHNSYASPDSVNSIKWNSLNDPDVACVREYYKGLIAFRKANSAFRMTKNTAKRIRFFDGLPNGVIAYTAGRVNFVVYNPTADAVVVPLPYGKWNVYVKGSNAGTSILETVSVSVTVEALSCTALVMASE